MKKEHQIATALEDAIRRRLVEKKNQLGISDDALGKRTFAPLGYSDCQKKVNNLLRGQKAMGVAEFYVLCEGLGLPPDRVFTTALDEVLAIKKATAEISLTELHTKKNISSPAKLGFGVDVTPYQH